MSPTAQERRRKAVRIVNGIVRKRPWPTVNELTMLVEKHIDADMHFAPVLITMLREAGLWPTQEHQPNGIRK